MKAIEKLTKDQGNNLLIVHRDGSVTWTNGHLVVFRGVAQGCPLPPGHYKKENGLQRFSSAPQGRWVPVKKTELPDFNLIIPRRLGDHKALAPVEVGGSYEGLIDLESGRHLIRLANGRVRCHLDLRYYEAVRRAFPNDRIEAVGKMEANVPTDGLQRILKVIFVGEGDGKKRGRSRVRAIVMVVRVDEDALPVRKRQSRAEAEATAAA